MSATGLAGRSPARVAHDTATCIAAALVTTARTRVRSAVHALFRLATAMFQAGTLRTRDVLTIKAPFETVRACPAYTGSAVVARCRVACPAQRDAALVARAVNTRLHARVTHDGHDHDCCAVPKRRVAHVRLCSVCQFWTAVPDKETDCSSILEASNLGVQGTHTARRVQLQSRYENCTGADRLDGNRPHAVLLLLMWLLRVLTKACGKCPCWARGPHALADDAHQRGMQVFRRGCCRDCCRVCRRSTRRMRAKFPVVGATTSLASLCHCALHVLFILGNSPGESGFWARDASVPCMG
jgi:hypothetical protein